MQEFPSYKLSPGGRKYYKFYQKIALLPSCTLAKKFIQCKHSYFLFTVSVFLIHAILFWRNKEIKGKLLHIYMFTQQECNFSGFEKKAKTKWNIPLYYNMMYWKKVFCCTFYVLSLCYCQLQRGVGLLVRLVGFLNILAWSSLLLAYYTLSSSSCQKIHWFLTSLTAIHSSCNA